MDEVSRFKLSAKAEPGSMVKVSALVPRSLHRDFLTVMPQKGAIVWTVRAAMESVVHLLQNEPGLRHRMEVMLRQRINELPDYLTELTDEPEEITEADDNDFD